MCVRYDNLTLGSQHYFRWSWSSSFPPIYFLQEPCFSIFNSRSFIPGFPRTTMYYRWEASFELALILVASKPWQNKHNTSLCCSGFAFTSLQFFPTTSTGLFTIYTVHLLALTLRWKANSLVYQNTFSKITEMLFTLHFFFSEEDRWLGLRFCVFVRTKKQKIKVVYTRYIPLSITTTTITV